MEEIYSRDDQTTKEFLSKALVSCTYSSQCFTIAFTTMAFEPCRVYRI